MQKTYITKKIVLMTEIPEDVLARAQVLIVDGEDWHALGPVPYRAHGNEYVEDAKRMVRCPIVEVSGVEDEEKMMEIMQACVDPTFGVLNRAGLLTGLEALGASFDYAGEDTRLRSGY